MSSLSHLKEGADIPKTERCPFCGTPVKPENLVRHLDTNHPRNADARAMREDLKREPGRAPSRSGPHFRLRRIHVAVVAAVIVLALGAYYVAPFLAPTNNLVAFCGSEGSALHYHTLLVVNTNGIQQYVPADIGISPTETAQPYVCPAGQLHVLHTHDTSGIIHDELPQSFVTASPTLGDFFSIWGQPLNPGTVWKFSGSVSAHVYTMSSGQSQDYSPNPRSIPLSAPPTGQDAYPIPQYLIFYGQNGNTGQSGGVFSGEIVFLNVTTA